MKIFDKIKNALFEEDEDGEEQEQTEIAKKIDVKKTISENEYQNSIKSVDPIEEVGTPFNYKKEEKPKGPIIFDVDDFIEEQPKVVPDKPSKPEKILYGGYESNFKEPEKAKEKFHPSPIISPVYGVLDKNYTPDDNDHISERKSLDNLFIEERKKKIDLDTVRQKAYGATITPVSPVVEEKEESSLLYEMQNKEEAPGIGKITLGDAEEYFDDLGLEYNVDYTDLAKQNKKTRIQKNRKLTDEVDEEIKGQDSIDKEFATENVKENNLSDEIKKPIIEDRYEEPEEKSLYDLIDMMYDSKE